VSDLRPVNAQPLQDLLARLEHERLDADRVYNTALTAVNHALQTLPPLPDRPAPYDATRLPDLNQSWRILAAPSSATDRSWRGRLRNFIWRLVTPPFELQQSFNAALVDHLNRNAASDRALPEVTAAVTAALRQAIDGLVSFESRLVQYLMTITAYVDTKDRRLGAQELAQHLTFVEQRLFAVTREIERLQKHRGGQTTPPAGDRADDEAFASPVASMTYVGFEDLFRGTQQDIRTRVDDYLPILSPAANVVDIGCGRGEMLDALRERGVTARGVDANHSMVELCRARGLEVEESDAVSFLQRQPAESIGGLVAIQVVEHFTPGYLLRFLGAASAALAPGAPLVLETINPACWMAFFETYIRDLTHQRPLHPDTLKYLVQASGFSQVDVQFRRPLGDADRLNRVAEAPSGQPLEIRALTDAVNAHADKLNARLFSFADYVIIARR
jgi:2-polyprenyl-3-methyl-5-hydroxy-6-metoxy-1,4-benzoquinol methylase